MWSNIAIAIVCAAIATVLVGIAWNLFKLGKRHESHESLADLDQLPQGEAEGNWPRD
ncbi:MAG: hypothetical protein ACT4QC_04235 [Planctomycetaceae bacterium]